MTIAEAIPIVQDFQNYRRGAEPYKQEEKDLTLILPKHSAEIYGEAIDALLNFAIDSKQ